jgi:hypothetical protein
MDDEYLEGLSEYDSQSPDMVSIKRSWFEDTENNSGFYDRLDDNYRQRRNQWPGKTPDLRKNHPDARPYQYASDNEAWVIDPRIDAKVATCWNAWQSAQVSAIPVGSDDVERASSITNFMRYTMGSWVKNPQREFNLAANYMFEKTFAATYVGWRKLRQKLKERLSLEEIAMTAPEIAELYVDPELEDEAVEYLSTQFEFVDEKVAKRALKELRKTGFAELPVSETSINEPIVSTKAQDSEIFFPNYTTDPEDSDRAHVVSFMSRSRLIATARAEDWDEDVLEDILDRHMGVTQDEIDGEITSDFVSRHLSDSPDTQELALIVRTLIRRVDPDDGALGIYEVVWCPRQAQDEDDEKYLAYDLINGLDCLPIAITSYKDDAKRLFEGRSDCELLRGVQRDVKILSDLGCDNANLAMDPPRYYPVGGNLPRWSSGASIAIRRGTKDDYGTFDVPNMMPTTAAMNEYYDRLADRIVGLDLEDPSSVQRLQYSVSRMLLHWSKVCKLVWKLYKLYGPEEKMFRITNDPTVAPATFEKGSENEEIDISIQFDVQLNNPEYREKITENAVKIMSMDTEGAADRRELLNILYNINLPQFASRVLRTAQEAQDDIVKKVEDDLAKIASGQGQNAREGGAAIAMPYIQQYASQPDIAQKLAADPAWAERLRLYFEQYQFQVTQAENAGIGQRGTANPTVAGGGINAEAQ